MTAAIITIPAARIESGAGKLSAASQSTMRLRLTRRGRVVLGSLTVLAIGVAMGLAAILGAPGASAADVDANPAAFAYVIVQPGDSLWTVASTLDPSADPRDIISEIVALNQLDASSVLAGQPIAVPLRYSQEAGVLSASQLGL